MTMKMRAEWVALAILAGLLPVTVSNAIDQTPVAYLPGIQADWERRADDMGITVIFTDDERNCGAQLGNGAGGGCFDPATPDVIYIGTGLDARALEYTALHELGHAFRYQTGVAVEGFPEECAADRLADSWGAVGPFNYCSPA